MERPLDWKPGDPLINLELEALTRTLEKFEGNRTHAARALGLSIQTIRNKIRRFGIASPERPGRQVRRSN